MAPKAYPEKHSKNIFTRGKKINIFLVMCIVLFSVNFIIAAEGDVTNEEFMTDWDGTCGDFDCDELEIRDAGVTPDDFFYFIDNLFDQFGDNLEIREEKIAEIKLMVEAGKFEAAKEALEKYKEHAEALEEINPEREEDTKKSSETIEKTLREIENEIPEEYKKDFVGDVIEKEGKIRTAVEISSKIKELCIQLAELDPVEYSKVCDFKDDAPKWKKDLAKDLTEEQRKEAKEFGTIMSQCFKTSGRNCDCEDISFYDFSLACSKIAPLAIECDEGSENACREMDEIEMPRLPDHLEDILEDIENQYSEGKYDMHMPPECVEAGVTNPKECGRIMIKENAPIECRKALLDADVQSEREGRKICDKIMFELHAPRECIDEEITDPEECKDFMDSFRGPEGPGGFGAPGQNCMEIEDKMKRLDCFEGAVGDMGARYGVGEKFEDGNVGEITWQCKENRIHWGPDCKRFMEEEWPEQERMRQEERNREWEQKDDWRIKEGDCANNCERDGKPWSFYNGICRCGDPGSYADNQGGFYGGEDSKSGEWNGYDCSVIYCGDNSHCEPDRGCVSDGRDDFNNDNPTRGGDGTSCGEGYEDDGRGGCIPFGTGDYQSNEPQYAPGEGSGEPGDYNEPIYNEPISNEPVITNPEPEPVSEPVVSEPTSEPEPSVTGGVINNKFLRYYNR